MLKSGYDTDNRAIRQNQGILADTAGERKNGKPHVYTGAFVRGRERVQVEGAAHRVRQLEQRIQKGQPLGEGRRVGTGVHGVTEGTDNSRHHRGSGAGQHVHQGSPRRARRFKKKGKQAIGKSKGGWNTKLHVVSADDQVVVEMHLSGGECHDAPEGRKSIETVGKNYAGVPLLMDKAYEGDETRGLARANGHEPIVPPKSNRTDAWEYDKEMYKKRNVVERLFRRIKGFRRVCTRYDKTDVMFMAFVQFAFTVIWLN